MQRKLLITKDGSHTVSIPEMNVTYHSIHGAIQESRHVFIEAGLHGSECLQQSEPCRILEMGFGTGLNALLTLIEAEKTGKIIHYETMELYPLREEEARSLNYCRQLNRPDLQQAFEKMHSCNWEREIVISNNFTLKKSASSPINHLTNHLINLIYFDAFAPAAQPELWTKEVFEKLYSMMKPGGTLVTYCSKGNVRRAMQSAGFAVEKIPGPPGKREMLRGRKVIQVI